MRIEKIISTVDTHTAGEPTRIITSGMPHIHGSTMMEKKLWLQNNMDSVRRMVMLEPRGHKDMFGAIITEPVSDDAEAGVIFMDAKGYLDMCGHGSIGSVTVLLNTGIIPMENEKNVRDEAAIENLNENDNTHQNSAFKKTSRKVVIDTPAGKIIAHATIENGAATEVAIRNVPSFYYDCVVVEVPSIGKIQVDIAYGGNFFALVNAKDLGMEVDLVNLDKLTHLGIEIRDRVNSIINVIHPGTGQECEVRLTEIYEGSDSKRQHFTNNLVSKDSFVYTNNQVAIDYANYAPCKNVVVFGNGQIDRSPCGTGTCAKMAYLYEKGRLAIDEPYLHASIINTVFGGKIVKETVVGDKKAILPEIIGSAYITGFHTFIAQNDDPFKEGFAL